LYGLGGVRFEGFPETKNISYETFIAQFEANFRTGQAYIDIYHLLPTEHADGTPIKALLPPGSPEAAALDPPQ
jgi:hypothetical protein